MKKISTRQTKYARKKEEVMQVLNAMEERLISIETKIDFIMVKLGYIIKHSSRKLPARRNHAVDAMEERLAQIETKIDVILVKMEIKV